MSDYRIDSHKLIYHIDRINCWLNGENICPVYMEISPCGTCNHRCIFCAFEYLEYKAKLINKDILIKRISELSKLGVKSIMYAGEGEPFIHKNMTEFIIHTKKSGIDCAVATNAVLINKKITNKCLSSLTWIRISMNAGTKETYKKIHKSRDNDFNTVIKNMEEMVKIKKKNKYKCTIGVQIILLPENFNEIIVLAKLLKNIGLDYLTIKPFIKHPMSKHNIAKNFRDSDLLELDEKIKTIPDNNFKIIFRLHGFQKLSEKKPYKKCLGLPFFAEIVSDGNVYTCGPYLGNENFCYGNIYKNTFKEIWESKRRKKILEFIQTKLNPNKCMTNCRLDEINRYLWELKNPTSHVNFI